MKMGTLEILAILAIVLVIFGPSQLPKLTKMFGKSVKSFREGVDEEKSAGEKPVEQVAKDGEADKE